MRDRHGRGLRGPLLPATMPGALSRRERFDRMVARAAGHLAMHCPEVRAADIVVEDVPLVPRRAERAPLGRVVRQTSPPQLVVHRRPLEQLGAPPELVRDLLAELAADLLAKSPDEIDPHYPRD